MKTTLPSSINTWWTSENAIGSDPGVGDAIDLVEFIVAQASS